MLAALAFVFFAVVSPGGSAQPPVIREVVYRVSSLTLQSLHMSTYAGFVPNVTGLPHQPGGFEPTQKGAGSSQEGRITVDVLDVVADVVHVKLSEDFTSRAAPLVYEAYVEPNGLVRYSIEFPSSIAEYLLPLFGTKFAASPNFADGDSWQLGVKTRAVVVDDVFTIAGRDGQVLLLDERRTVRLNSARGMNLDVQGKFKYKPSLLVPIVGDVEERGSRSTVDTVNELKTTVHFERVSDSLEPVLPK